MMLKESYFLTKSDGSLVMDDAKEKLNGEQNQLRSLVMDNAKESFRVSKICGATRKG